MIQDKIFFDEKDPTGLSYNTPFTYFGSYQGRLWSKAPGGEIKYYTQNSDLSVYATTGSNQFNGNQTITGSLTVTGGIIGTAATSSYVEYSNVANKPTLVSGSSQVSFSGIINKPTLVSGSSQVSFSGITNKPTLVSSSVQVKEYNVFATTGSNGFNGSQSITGSLTVTGQVIAQTINVQQVTSSIVYSSGSNIFGNNSGNTHQFTGSLNVNGQGTFYQPLTNSTSYLTIQNNRARNAAVYTQTTNGGFYAGTSIGTDTFNYQIYDGVAGTARLTIASTGAATFNTTATTAVSAISTGTASGLQLTNSGGTASSWIIQSDGGAVAGQAALRFYSLTASAYRMSIDGSGNVGIGTTSPSSRLNVAGAKTNSADLTNAANQLVVTDTTATAAGVGGRISFFGSYTATPDYITFGTIEVLKDNANNYGSAGWNNAAMRFIVGNNDNDANAGRMLERMRITSNGNVGIGTILPSTQLNVGHESHGVGISYLGGSALPAIAGIFTSDGTAGGQTGYGSLLVKARSDFGGFYSINFFTAASANTPIERMRITSGGDLQINYNPGGGSLYFRDTTAGAVMFYIIPATYVGTSPFNSNRFLAANSSHISFETGGLERMRITSDGFVTTDYTSATNGGLIARGIEYSIKSVGSLTGYTQGAIVVSSGTDSVPSARGQGIFYFNEGNDITWYNGGLYNATDRWDICRKTGTSVIDASTAQTTHTLFNLNSSGAAYNATGTWGTISSDQRLKENIVDATSKLDDVMSLKVRNFNYIGKEEKYIGFIAQELEEVFPSLVTTNDMREFDRDGNVVGGLEDTKGVKVGMDFAILVKAIQEQQSQIEILKAEIQTLKQ